MAERALALPDFGQHDRGVLARVRDDLAQRLLDRAGQDLDADGLVFVGKPGILGWRLPAPTGRGPSRVHDAGGGRLRG